jgi:transcriptional regulator with XRE-family HTH domain
MSANGLARAAKAKGFKLGQRSVSRILELTQDPTLEKLYEIAQTLDVSVRSLIADEGIKKPLQNVVSLPSPYRKIFGKKSQPAKQVAGNIRKSPIRK